MTVETTNVKNQLAMTISLIEFTFTFRTLYSTPSNVKCIRTNDDSGAEEDMEYVTEIPTDSDATDVLKYTVTVNEDGVGGTVKVAWPSTKSTITIYRETTDTQASDYEDYNQFPADTVETDFDKRTMKSQEMDEALARTIKFSIAAPTGSSLPTPSADTFLGWDGDGILLENKTIASGGTLLVKATESVAMTGTNDEHYMTPLQVKNSLRSMGTIGVYTLASISMMDAAAATAGLLIVTTSATVELLTGSTAQINTCTTVILSATTSTISNLHVQTISGVNLRVAGAAVGFSYTETASAFTCATIIPSDDTEPLITEGNQVLVLAHTAKKATNRLLIHFHAIVSTSTGDRRVAAALFRSDATGSTIGVTSNTEFENQKMIPLDLPISITPGTINAVTYSVRVGPDSGVVTLNGENTARQYGGGLRCTLSITEFEQ